MMDLVKIMSQSNGPNGMGPMFDSIRQAAQKFYDLLCAIENYLAPQKAYKPFARTTTSTVLSDLGFSDADTHLLPFTTKRLDITLFDNNCFVQMARVIGDPFAESFELIAPGFYSIPAGKKRIRIRSAVFPTQSRYSIVAWA